MRSSTIQKIVAVCLFSFITMSPVSAYWVEETFLAELNENDYSYPAHRPSISCDENTIFYTLADAHNDDWGWEAQRNPDTGIFDKRRVLSELINNGLYTYSAWYSQNNLTLYYSSPSPE